MAKTKTKDIFHGCLDTELGYTWGHSGETKHTKHIEILERDLSYRFYPHFHPYVGQLTQRLLQRSIGGLQEADTLYAAKGRSLPGSIEISLASGVNLSIPAGSRIVLNQDVQITISGQSLSLASGMQLRIKSQTQGTMLETMGVTLVEGMDNTPALDEKFKRLQDVQAVSAADVELTLSAVPQVLLHDGTTASFPAGIKATLLSGTHLVLPAGTEMTLKSRKLRPELYTEIFSTEKYKPTNLVQLPYPAKNLDFTSSGAYSVYNWELFFHVPLTIAMHLSKNQRFAEAQRWFHYIFDPTDDSDGPTPERFWRVLPFQSTDVKKIEEILVNLSTDSDPDLRTETVRSIEAWKDQPFRPHVVARYRQQAYMFKTVMAYLDNLIAWGDSLYRQDTGESIDEALMIYVLAANILGPRPQSVPKKGSVRPQTYANLRADLDAFGNAMRDLEPDIPYDLMPFPAEIGAQNDRLATLRSLGKALYFCVPPNDKLITYWDTVADRLFKIRNSLNIQGIFRQLALFEPPIDPAMLARAAAAGLDVGAIVNGLNQPLPLVRFALLVQKAAEVAQEVKSLGNSLLSAMEKEDGETLAILRAKHERIVMEMVEQVKYAQVQEAGKSYEGLLKSLALAVQRYTYYERQLGKKTDEIAIPEIGELDADSLSKMKFAMSEPELQPREIEVDIFKGPNEEGGKLISKYEDLEITKLKEARKLNEEAGEKDKIAAGLSLLPELGVAFEFWGIGGNLSFGGSALSRGMSLWASFAKTDAEKKTYESGNSARINSFARREQEWAFQSNLAAGEITQIFRQLRAAQIRQAIAQRELESHRKQMKHAEEIERYLNAEGTEKNGKKANKALYAWMKREVKGLYGQCFQFAFDIAKKAERALQHELGNKDFSYLQFGYLAGKEGLLAGEKLHLDIKRMEMGYHENNRREYELTKHISLLQVSPLALLQLRTTGRCTITVPEEVFDMDGPGHYFRRIKSVAVSIPCVVGPYASVNCTLTLLKSSIRTTAVVGDGVYARENAEDDRFNDYFGSLQSIVTSSAQNDSGLFETNLRDERYLPFEGSGAISEWQLELPADPSKSDPRQFDYDTISDVILHVRYTAREGGGLLKQAATENLKSLIKEAGAAGCVRLFSVRHEFPSEWAKFQGQTLAADKRFELALPFCAEHYPFWSQGRLNSVVRLDILARSTRPSLDVFDNADKEDTTAKSDTLVRDPSFGNMLAGKLANIALPEKPVGVFRVFLNNKDIEDIWIVITWSGN